MKYKIKWASILGDRSLINKNKNDKIYVLEYVYVWIKLSSQRINKIIWKKIKI